MNEYKITYSGESEGYRIITDRTEAAAKKFFREEAKRLDLGHITIENVELLNTNALASKRNERETLEVIRQMVADLGESSYLATAFEGCFEDAESNIENDFGDSMKARYESSERKLAEAQEQINILQGKLTEEIAEKQRARNEAQEVIRRLEAKFQGETRDHIKRLEAKVLSDDDLADICQLLKDRATEAEEATKKYAAEIVEHAEDPAGKEFQEAVRLHRNYTWEAEYTRKLLERVVAAKAATNTTADNAAA